MSKKAKDQPVKSPRVVPHETSRVVGVSICAPAVSMKVIEASAYAKDGKIVVDVNIYPVLALITKIEQRYVKRGLNAERPEDWGTHEELIADGWRPSHQNVTTGTLAMLDPQVGPEEVEELVHSDCAYRVVALTGFAKQDKKILNTAIEDATASAMYAEKKNPTPSTVDIRSEEDE